MKSATLIILLIIVILAVVGGVWYYEAHQVPHNIPQPSPPLSTTQPVVANSTTTPTSSSMLGWKTYTNDLYGFSFKYPPNYTVKNNTLNNNEVPYFSIDSPTTAKMFQETGGESSDEIRIYPAENQDELNGNFGLSIPVLASANYFQSQTSSAVTYLGSMTTINGNLGFKLDSVGESEVIDTLFQKPNGVWMDVETQLTGTSTSMNIEPYNTIISSFQFGPV